jgi:hypothetical protein
MSLRRVALIPLALALVLGACSSGDDSDASSSDTASATTASGGATGTDGSEGSTAVPEGFTVVDRSGDGFVIALPPGWQSFDLTATDVDAIIAAAAEANPALAGNIGDAVKQLVAEGGLLYASDISNPGDFLTNVNLIRVQGVTSGLGLLQQQAQSQLTAAGATNVSSTQVQLPAGDAVRTTYTVPVTLADGTTTEVAGLQVYFLTQQNLYVLTFSTNQPDQYTEIFDQVIATFEPA